MEEGGDIQSLKHAQPTTSGFKMEERTMSQGMWVTSKIWEWPSAEHIKEMGITVLQPQGTKCCQHTDMEAVMIHPQRHKLTDNQ